MMNSNIVKLGDFGISSIGDSGRDMIAGTPYYIAPEILKSEIHTEKVDIFSLGVTIFELYTHRFPFQNTIFQEQELLPFNLS